MTNEQWQLVNELFDQALERAPGDVDTWLSESSGNDLEVEREVRSLLASDQAITPGALEQGVKSAVVSFAQTDAPTKRMHAGPYVLLEELGRGGMGTVYLAERDDGQYKSSVAVKLVRAGMDTDFILTRFRRERQTLARLEHPNIARLLDGGNTESGLPYIVMEYVKGSWITDYCAARLVGIKGRLQLFLQVCAAVEYAHLNFVVHRDIKPGNILVEDATGTPKLLDFGVCKLLYSESLHVAETSVGMLTPDYASPEQIRGDPINVVSDVYSLGAVLYELLCGEKPHKFLKPTAQEIERVICDVEVPAPSVAVKDKRLARSLAGDLDTIVLRSLEKDVERRISSVTVLAEEIERYLTDAPIKSRPQTLAYRAVKFSRRYHGPLLAAAIVLCTFLTGAVVSYRQAQIAQQRLQQIRTLSKQMVFDVHDAIADLPGATNARNLVLSVGLANLDALAESARKDPHFQLELAAAYRRLADVQGSFSGSSLGGTTAALSTLQKAKALLDQSLLQIASTQAEVQRLGVESRIAGILARSTDSKQALLILNKAVDQGEGLLTKTSDPILRLELGEIYNSRSEMKRNLLDYDKALADGVRSLHLFQEVATTAERTNVQSVSAAGIEISIASALATIGMAEARTGRLTEALEHFRENTTVLQRLVKSNPDNTRYRRELMLAYGHAGDVLGNKNMPNLGNSQAALEEYRMGAVIAKHIYDSDRADQRAASDYGIALSRVTTLMPNDDLTAKLALQKDALNILSAVSRVNPVNTSNRIYLALLNQQIGDSYRSQGDWRNAIRFWREALKESQKTLPLGQANGAMFSILAFRRLGEAAVREGQLEEARGFADKLVSLGDESKNKQPLRFVVPRAYGAAGFIYLDLAKSARSKQEDGKFSRDLFQKSLNEWKKTSSDAAFSTPHRTDMAEVEAALLHFDEQGKVLR